MKYIITESQYKILLREDRVEFLKNQNVIDPKVLDQSVEGEEEATDERRPGGMNPNKPKIEPIEDHNGVDIAYIVSKKGKQSIKLAEQTFNDIVEADPTRNKQYVQWMIQVFMRHINDGDIDQAVRFLSEDLPEANEFLTVFDTVKNKKVFKRSAPNRPNAPQNVTDINQYNDLSHLYSVVSPFIGAEDDESEEGGESPLWRKLKKFIDLGEAKLTYRNNDILIYTPLTRDASCEPLGPLSSWCTRRPDNSFFDSYRRDKPKPDGTLSDYYVIMPKALFSGDDEGGMYPLQFHFESNQLHDKSNGSIEGSKLNNFLSKYPGVADFFKKELGALVEMDVRRGTGLMDSSYIKYLNMFGGKAQEHISGEAYEEGVRNIRKMASQQNVPLQNNKYLRWLMENTEGVNVVEFLDAESTSALDFSGLNLNELPNLSNFSNLETLIANNCGLEKMPPVEYLPVDAPLTVMTFNGNRITEAPPKGYEKLQSLFSMSLKQNPINRINVETLSLLVDNDFIRFAADRDVMNNLTPENLSQMEEFLSDKGSGMLAMG
jgi:Leucine-rich repeat (LRR) protein